MKTTMMTFETVKDERLAFDHPDVRNHNAGARTDRNVLPGRCRSATRRKGLESLQGLTFSDVLILPELTDICPDQVNLTSQILPNLVAGLPIWSAPMASIWSHELTLALAECGGLTPLHRDMNIKELKAAIDELCAAKVANNKVFQNVTVNSHPPIIVAVSPFDEGKLKYLTQRRDIDFIILDSVQPYSSAVLKVVARHSRNAPHKIIVGNIVTSEAAEDFCRYKIAALKVGLGPGSICTTRSISGVGVPQLEAVHEVAKVASKYGIRVIADGGIRELGDIAKAIAAGADSVMMGNLFAGTNECAGKTIELEGVLYKRYVGSRYGSVEHSRTNISEIDGFFMQPHIRIEGAGGLVAYKGSAKVLMYQIKRALGATLAFVGASSINDFRSKVRLIKVSAAAYNEGQAHSLSRTTDCNCVVGIPRLTIG